MASPVPPGLPKPDQTAMPGVPAAYGQQNSGLGPMQLQRLAAQRRALMGAKIPASKPALVSAPGLVSYGS